MKKSYLHLLVFVSVAMSWAAQAQPPALTQPFFEISGGVLHIEPVVPGGNFIPVGASGYDSRDASPAVTVTLRDPGYSGTRTVCVDYVGTDASFENQFQAPGINWCNKAAGTCDDPAATGLGAGSMDWTAGAPRLCFDAQIGQPVPFNFIADVLDGGGDGAHTVGNGQTNPGAHWAPLVYPFELNDPTPPRSGDRLAIGLSDGAYDPFDDDDHQDFAVLFTVQGIPIPPASGIPTLPEWWLATLAVLLVLVVFIWTRRFARVAF